MAGCGARGASHSQIALATRAPAASAPASAVRGGRRRAGSAAIRAAAEDEGSALHSSARLRSPADCQRSSGSLARHCFTTRSSAGGVSGASAAISGGSPPMMAEIRDAWLLPSNARRPVVISYSTQPSAHRSLRASASFPSSCSGDMYWKVPTIVPSAVSGCAMVGDWVSAAIDTPLLGAPASPVARARPKSISLAPLLVSMMFPGLRSRWITPARWARSSASAICPPSLTTSAVGSAPRVSRCASVSPSTSSITR